MQRRRILVLLSPHNSDFGKRKTASKEEAVVRPVTATKVRNGDEGEKRRKEEMKEDRRTEDRSGEEDGRQK